MGTNPASEILQQKTWQLGQTHQNGQGYLYSCGLCDEALVLSRQFIKPRKVQLVFTTCPGCGFELEKTLRVQQSALPAGKRLLTNQSCRDADQLVEPEEFFDSKLSRGSELNHEVRSDLTTGIDALDEALVLRFGQLVSLQGEASNALSHLLCVRAVHPLPPGLDSDVVFVDGGNVFDAYTVSHHASSLGLDQEKTKERIHLSRAFTHHQLSGFITQKLARAVDQTNSSLAIVSDITALYCDPDVREKKEPIDLFSRDTRFLARLAQQRNMIIIITNLQSRSKPMDQALNRTSHVSASLQDKGSHTQLTITKHPFIREGQLEVVTLDNQTLTRYL